MTVVLRHVVYPYESACIEVIAASQVSKQRGMYANPGKNLYGRSNTVQILTRTSFCFSSFLTSVYLESDE